jgi:hypothetical protein
MLDDLNHGVEQEKQARNLKNTSTSPKVSQRVETHQHDAAGVLSPPPTPGATWGGGTGGGTACSPFTIVQGAGGHNGGVGSHTGALGATPAGWGPLAGASEIRNLRWGSRPPV